MASNARAIRSGVASSGDTVGRFAVTFWGFCTAARAGLRDAVLRGFLDI
jgi:hypothetical protein